MSIVAIPIRSFSSGKTRLAAVLDPSLRHELASRLAGRAVAAAVGAGAAEVVIIAGAAEVRQWAKDRDLTLLDDPGGGLNPAAVSAANYAATAEAPWVVLHADLPLVTGNALQAIVAAAGAGPVIAPSYDGGTSALGDSGTESRRGFAYGPASFQAHLARSPAARVIVDYRLAIDVDRPHDLQVAARLPGGEWLQRFLGSSE